MIKFGTGGWREIIGDNFTKKNVQKIAKALSDMIKENNLKKTICIGYDRRFLSKEGAIWASEVFVNEGIHVYFVNKSQPTPLIMYSVKELELDYGMCITASHNPALYNGIKVFTYGGRDANEIVTKELQDKANEVNEYHTDVEFYNAIKEKKIEYLDYFNEYIDSILDKVDVNAIRKARLKIVLDPMYGVSQTSLRTILSTTRCELLVINDRHDTLFGGKLPTPNSEGLQKLRYTVLDTNSNLGIATDGDADRIGIIDDKGNFLHPNEILVLLYYYLVKFKGMKGDVVRNNSTTHMLDKIADSFGYQCHEVNVGFKYISSMMKETNAIIGGESSGGLTVDGHIYGKDGIYAASILIEMIAVCNKSMSQLMSEIREIYGNYKYVDANITFKASKKEFIQELVLVKKELPNYPYEIDHISYKDGCKVWFKNGYWIIIRFSGTEPLLRVAAEGLEEDEVQNLIEITRKFIDENS